MQNPPTGNLVYGGLSGFRMKSLANTFCYLLTFHKLFLQRFSYRQCS